MRNFQIEGKSNNKITLGIFLITALTLNVIGCTSRSISDSQGRVNLPVPASQLDSNGCPHPQNLKLTDSQGNKLSVLRVEKQADGTCTVLTQ